MLSVGKARDHEPVSEQPLSPNWATPRKLSEDFNHKTPHFSSVDAHTSDYQLPMKNVPCLPLASILKDFKLKNVNGALLLRGAMGGSF